MNTQPKRMLIHSYNGEHWETHEYPTVREMKKKLHEKGVHFDNNNISALGSNSTFMERDGILMEIEEAIEEPIVLLIEGKIYIPVRKWAENHSKTVRQARYAFKKHRVNGMIVGRRNYLFLEDEDGER